MPNTGDDIFIPDLGQGANYPVFNSNFQAGNIVLEGDATLTMAPNSVLSFAAGKGAS